MIAYLVACLFIPSQDYDCVRMADFQTIEQCESSISDFQSMKIVDSAYCEIEYDDIMED